MIKIRQIKVSILKDTKEELINKISKKLNIKEFDIKNIKISKKSIDARTKENIYYVYEVIIDVNNENKIKLSNDVIKYKEERYSYKITGIKNMKERPVIVGSGPSGLFLGYMLSICGYNPIIIERGEKIEDRIKTVDKFFKEGILNKNSNIQFGEGGAGTFSDGKLNTLVKDKREEKVFEIFTKFGAPKEILYEAKPHIGTDILREVIKNMRNKMIEYGCTFKYNSTLTDINIKDNEVKSIIINNKEEIPCETLVLGIGHSARDTFKMLYEKGIKMVSKPFAVGIRIQHPKDLINEAMYGKYFKYLPTSSYKLTYKAKDSRGVYSFCMCPGGFVVNSSSDEKGIVINGMSNYKRDEKNSNSALIVTVDENDYGKGLFDGMNFQKQIEEKAYKIGKGKIPTQNYIDLKNNKESKELLNEPSFKGSYTLSNINEILPDYICNDLIEAIEYFNTKIKGYNNDNAIISAPETRTSSPVRILRDENYQTNIKGIYPIGEGSGYSGGITTSAMDGIRCFEKIISIYKLDK